MGCCFHVKKKNKSQHKEVLNSNNNKNFPSLNRQSSFTFDIKFHSKVNLNTTKALQQQSLEFK